MEFVPKWSVEKVDNVRLDLACQFCCEKVTDFQNYIQKAVIRVFRFEPYSVRSGSIV